MWTFIIPFIDLFFSFRFGSKFRLAVITSPGYFKLCELQLLYDMRLLLYFFVPNFIIAFLLLFTLRFHLQRKSSLASNNSCRFSLFSTGRSLSSINSKHAVNKYAHLAPTLSAVNSTLSPFIKAENSGLDKSFSLCNIVTRLYFFCWTNFFCYACLNIFWQQVKNPPHQIFNNSISDHVKNSMLDRMLSQHLEEILHNFLFSHNAALKI